MKGSHHSSRAFPAAIQLPPQPSSAVISLTQPRMSLQRIASGPTVVVVGLCLAGGNGWVALRAADFLEAEERVVPLPSTVVADPLGMPIVPPSGLGRWLETSARGGE